MDDIDLVHYSAVHHAYRHNKLRCFLTFMEMARNEPYWPSVKSCKETQFVVIDVFLKGTAESVVEAVRLLPLWLNEQQEEVSETSPINAISPLTPSWPVGQYRAA